MGEAARRGSFEERVRQSVVRKRMLAALEESTGKARRGVMDEQAVARLARVMYGRGRRGVTVVRPQGGTVKGVS